MLEEKISQLRERNDYLTGELIKSHIVSNQQKFKKLAREQNEINQIINYFDQLARVENQIKDDQEIIDDGGDEELVTIAREEISDLEEEKLRLEEEIKFLLIPKDLNDSKNAIAEIRAGTGGNEAGIFAGNLYDANPPKF